MKEGRPLLILKNSPFTKQRNLKNKDKTIGVRVPEDVIFFSKNSRNQN